MGSTKVVGMKRKEEGRIVWAEYLSLKKRTCVLKRAAGVISGTSLSTGVDPAPESFEVVGRLRNTDIWSRKMGACFTPRPQRDRSGTIGSGFSSTRRRPLKAINQLRHTPHFCFLLALYLQKSPKRTEGGAGSIAGSSPPPWGLFTYFPLTFLFYSLSSPYA